MVTALTSGGSRIAVVPQDASTVSGIDTVAITNKARRTADVAHRATKVIAEPSTRWLGAEPGRQHGGCQILRMPLYWHQSRIHALRPGAPRPCSRRGGTTWGGHSRVLA